MSVRDYIEHMKSKPVHERRRFALFSSAAVTLVVATGWFGALAASGDLALKPSENDATAELVRSTEEGSDRFNDLVGAVNAFQTGYEGGAPIQVVDMEESSTLETETTGDATVIPF